MKKQKVDALLILFASICAGLFWLLFYLWKVSLKVLSGL